MKNVLKSSILVFVIIGLSSSLIFGQKEFDKMKREKMQIKKIAFITKKLDLSPEEAEKFWPIYNKENEKKHAYFDEIRKTCTNTNDEVLTDQEALQQANQLIEIESHILKTKKELIQQLDGVISGNKILLLMKAERQFKRSMMKGLKSGRMRSKRQAKGIAK